ncbi:hypothetical protein CYMTET_55824 [Cymbomonas tetramitiformis]|uniref:Uncharacterized protein n=1 Tax=Cymbomonas tetramitiformis TaxID=36881 RepID=A0AAE0BDF0_9CHLO|nr:hypothetical protein CYMTET_55824 [Cymbomonas tetramitiformis]
MMEFREELYQSWVKCGQDKPPLELVKLEAKGPIKFYPVDDGLGGGAVFTDNASAQEYLHLEEGTPESPRSDSACSDWSTIDAATKFNHEQGKSTGSSSQTWLTRDETRARDLRGAIGLAYSDLIDPGPEGQRSFRCVTLLENSVGTDSTHVLRCRENPNAKPVYYIFEDNSRHERGMFHFTDEYLQDERRKFTRLAYVTADKGAPWVRPALMLLERRLRSPAAVVEQVRQAHVAHRSEHTDEEMMDARTLDRGRQRWGKAAIGDPNPTGYE